MELSVGSTYQITILCAHPIVIGEINIRVGKTDEVFIGEYVSDLRSYCCFYVDAIQNHVYFEKKSIKTQLTD